MAFRIGWFSTGRDPAARNLLKVVRDDIIHNDVPANIEWIFCHRETGDAPANEEYVQREMFFEMAAEFNIPVATHSHVKFMPELRKLGIEKSASAAEPSPELERWRNLYGDQVVKTIRLLPEVDVIVMAGYMLIIGDPELESLDMINIHPALPWGPKGTWQEVIHQLIDQGADEQGIMVHLVTKELDRGPVISYCRFPINGMEWTSVWKKWDQEISRESSRDEKEQHGLFRKIRHEGEIRELPLLTNAIRELAFGRVSVKDKKIWIAGNPSQHGVDLTETIEASLIKNSE
ncbi:MAG: phosphoribosylglycinamide formyltransferase [Desulfomonilaceae bacterium]